MFFSVATIVFFFTDVKPQTLEFEVAKSLLQVGVVAVFGAVISLLVFEYQQERQAAEKTRDVHRKQLEYRESLLLSVLSRTMDAYGRVKKARRLIRGLGVDYDSQLLVVMQYDNFFETINWAQLDLETLARDVGTSANAFSNSEQLVEQLRRMEKYLGELISEYEQFRQQLSSGKGSLPLNRLPRLESYIQPAGRSEFKSSIVVPYHEIQRLIRVDLLHPNLTGESSYYPEEAVGMN